MSEPVTTNRSFIVPNTGDLPGSWGTSAMNPNWQTVDAMFGGVTTISLSVATTITLSIPATTGIWPSVLSQSVNSLIKFTGAQTGNAIIQITLPGFYIMENRCTGTSYVQVIPTAGGNAVGLPPGKKCHVFYDGSNMDYVNMPDPGTAYDLHTNTTSLPPWMLACTINPYLLKDGSTYSSATFPALAQLLGSTYGGNGITTFGVPDERNRFRLPVDTVQPASGTTSNRVTFAQAGFTGSLLGAAGGTSSITLVTTNLPPYKPSITVGGNINGLAVQPGESAVAVGSGSFALVYPGSAYGSLDAQAQGGASTPTSNVGPAIVSVLPLVKT